MLSLSSVDAVCTKVAKFPKIRRSRGRVVKVTARNRVLFYENELGPDGRIQLAQRDARAQHVTKVLKLQPGDPIKVGIVNRKAGTATVLQTEPSLVLKCLHWHQLPRLPEVHLVLAMPRPKVLKRLWSTLACLGVTCVHITGAAKVEPVYFGATALQEHIILPNLLIGAEQAGDVMLPSVFFSRSLNKTMTTVQTMMASVLYDNVSCNLRSSCLIVPGVSHVLTAPSKAGESTQHFKRDKSTHGMQNLGGPVSADVFCVAEMTANTTQKARMGVGTPWACLEHANSACNTNKVDTSAVKLLAHVESGVTVHQAITQQANSKCAGPVVLVVGPEGGWTADEIALLTDVHGFHTVTLAAGRTLDTTTAVIALLSSVIEALAEEHSSIR